MSNSSANYKDSYFEHPVLTKICGEPTYETLHKPIDLIFNFIDDLVKYARSAKSELTQSETINLALVIFHKQLNFKFDIQAWKRTNPEYKTWDNFKHYFQEVHMGEGSGWWHRYIAVTLA